MHHRYLRGALPQLHSLIWSVLFLMGLHLLYGTPLHFLLFSIALVKPECQLFPYRVLQAFHPAAMEVRVSTPHAISEPFVLKAQELPDKERLINCNSFFFTLPT